MIRHHAEAAPGVWVALVNGAPTGGRPTDHDLAEASALPRHRAAERLAARAVLRELLALHFPEARDAEVAYRPGGGPWLPRWPRIGISVSHDGNAAAACVALDQVVGVDVQHAGPTVSDRLLRRCVRDHAPALALLPDEERAREFAWVWTAQEACVKAEGTGMSGAPWSVDVTPLAARGSWGRYRWVSLRDRTTTPLSCAFAPAVAAPAAATVAAAT
jgi:4'-phosphopantetheinyl transferase